MEATYVALPEVDLEAAEVLPAEVAVPLVAAPEVAAPEVAPAEVAGVVAVVEDAAAVSVELPLAAEVPVDSPVKQLLSAIKDMSVGSGRYQLDWVRTAALNGDGSSLSSATRAVSEREADGGT